MLKSVVRALHRVCVAPLGMRKVRRMMRDGLPGPFRVPLEFLFSGRLDAEGAEVMGRVEAIRSEVARRTDTFEVVFGDAPDPRRIGPQLAYRSSVDARWGAFLYLCARSFGARSILELGSCAGISGCYLASSGPLVRMITVEASPSLAALARANIRRVSEKATLINALFDDALDQVLPSFTESIDLAYIDGHHERDATWHYFRRIMPHLRDGSLVVFDDIHWSKDMWTAWTELREQDGVSHALDVGRFGVCRWDRSAARRRTYSLAVYAGWLPGSRSSPQLAPGPAR